MDSICSNLELNVLLKDKAIQVNKVLVETTNLIGLDIQLCYEDATSHGRYLEEKSWEYKGVLDFLYAVTSQKGAKSRPSKELQNLLDNHYSPVREAYGLGKQERDGIPGNVLSELAKNITTCINVNIKMHFFTCQLKYLQLKYGLSKKEAKKRQDEINEEAKGKFGLKEESLPSNIGKSVAYDVVVYPEKFLFPMWKMNCFLESFNSLQEKKVKLFAIIPLSKGNSSLFIH